MLYSSKIKNTLDSSSNNPGSMAFNEARAANVSIKFVGILGKKNDF